MRKRFLQPRTRQQLNRMRQFERKRETGQTRIFKQYPCPCGTQMKEPLFILPALVLCELEKNPEARREYCTNCTPEKN